MAESTTKKRTTKVKEEVTNDTAVELLKEQNAELEAKLNVLMARLEEMQNTKVVAGSQKDDELVTLFFIAEVSKENVLQLPDYGSLRYGSYLEVPKKEFGGKFMSPLARLLIEKRELLVLNGLSKDERVRWNCDYKEGEVLSERAFDHILDYNLSELESLFSKLCEEHALFVARRFITAKESNDNRVTLEKAQLLNKLSKKFDEKGMLFPVLEAFKNEIV